MQTVQEIHAEEDMILRKLSYGEIYDIRWYESFLRFKDNRHEIQRYNHWEKVVAISITTYKGKP